MTFFYGRVLPVIPTYTTGPLSVDEPNRIFQDRTKVLQLFKDNFNDAQARMKPHADKHRIEREFEVGDWVFLRLQSYHQISINVHPSKNLAFTSIIMDLIKCSNLWFMLFYYHLDLPLKSKIHHVFHVSCLEKKLREQVFCQQ